MIRDGLHKCITRDAEAVILVIEATQLIQDTIDRIGSWPTASVHLGQAMMGVLLVQALSEDDEPEKVSFQWKAEGPFGDLFVEARNFGEVRGTILNPQAPVLDLKTGLGQGLLQVRRTKRNTVTGIVSSVGDVSLDIVEYLEKSEQRSCGMNLSVQLAWDSTPNSKSKVKVKHAVGYLIDVLPQKQKFEFDRNLLRWDRQMRALGPLSEWLLEPSPSENILKILSGEEHPRVVMSQRVKFSCSCSRDRAEAALAFADTQIEKEGRAKQKDITSYEEEEEIRVRCEFCGKVYLLTPSGN